MKDFMGLEKAPITQFIITSNTRYMLKAKRYTIYAKIQWTVHNVQNSVCASTQNNLRSVTDPKTL